MEYIYRNFYRNFYMRTGGFMPSQPLNQTVFPGDFFQIKNGEMIILGNIFRAGIIHPDDAVFEYGVRLNPSAWNFSHGVTKPYSGRGTGRNAIEGQFEFSKQIIAFAMEGSFFFKSNRPESVRIANWNELQQQLIIKLTQTFFSFRELYLVTECASASDWTLAVASSEKGELEIATDEENFGLVDIFGHQSARTIQSKNIEYYHREVKRNPSFFIAKKLVVQDEKLSDFITGLILQRQSQNEWAADYFDYPFEFDNMFTPTLSKNVQISSVDMLRANELNPNTALLYFKWADISLDDIEKLFLTYDS
ncbi:MAG TPA: hypothetical protein VD905_07905 [Flavobacteriales bacterium]|nr:hypothetical protein [Flavobacteriales bacterium]